MPEFDCIVVGAGPAGATAARNLARYGARVALLESSRFDKPRYGGTLAPEVNSLLKSEQLWEDFQAIEPQPSPGILSAWGSAQTYEVDFIRNVHGTGWHVDRLAFDRMLAKAAEKAGCVLFEGSRLESCKRDPGGTWSVQARDQDLRAALIIDAAGHHGFRCPWQPGRDIQDTLIATAVELAGTPPIADMRMYIESAPEGWWYSAPMAGGIVCMLFADSATYRHGRLDPLAEFQPPPLTARRTAGLWVARSRVLKVQSARARSAGDGWLAVGERAASYDPISGRGIFNALRDGAACAKAALACLDGRPAEAQQYAQRLEREFAAYSAERRRFYARERRWPSQPFWQNSRRLG